MRQAKRVNSTRTTSPDPAFAALDNHRKRDRAFLDLCRAQEAGLATEIDVRRASDAADDAAWRLARTEPTTEAGASALLTYITTGPITGLFVLGETDWHETAFRTVTAALAEITGQSHLAA
jgi:hypothetical protein